MRFPEDCTSQIGSNDGWVNKDLHVYEDQPSRTGPIQDRSPTGFGKRSELPNWILATDNRTDRSDDTANH